jgi:UDPglucose--hexose-1-phosphate uridylyltransferase
MIELRKDYVLDKYVILPHIAEQQTNESASEETVCPCCPGNEDMTPPSVLSFVVKEGMLQRTFGQRGECNRRVDCKGISE